MGKTQVSVMMSDKLLNHLKQEAKKEDRSVSGLIRNRLLNAYPEFKVEINETTRKEDENSR